MNYSKCAQIKGTFAFIGGQLINTHTDIIYMLDKQTAFLVARTSFFTAYKLYWLTLNTVKEQSGYLC